MNQWTEDLKRLVGSSQGRVPGELFEDLRDFGAAIGDDTAEALLDDNPDLFEFFSNLAVLNHQRVILPRRRGFCSRSGAIRSYSMISWLQLHSSITIAPTTCLKN